MTTLAQLLRQPTKTLFGILTVSLAVAALGICLGQAISVQKTEAELEYQFTTIALPTSNYNYKLHPIQGWQGSTPTMNQEVAAWVDEVIAAHPELVETVARPGLASAYIPGLVADHYQTGDYRYYYGNVFYSPIKGNTDRMLPQNDTNGYLSNVDTAMLAVTLEGIGEVTEVTYPMTLNRIDPNTGAQEKIAPVKQYRVILTGTVDQVISLAEALPDPTGWPIELELNIPVTQSLEDFDLEIGQQYMVYGFNFYTYTNQITYNGYPGAAPGKNDQDQFHILTAQQQAQWQALYPEYEVPAAIYGDLSILDQAAEDPLAQENSVPVMRELIEEYLRVSMSLYDFAAMPQFSYEDGSMILTRSVVENEETVTVSWEEYMERYSVPTITRLEGSVEDFLIENSFWQETLEYSKINNHAYPIIGVEKLDYIADFARELTRVTQGRDFTREELETGAKVCILSETLAQLNGLEVGDTITPQFYNAGWSTPYQSYVQLGENTVNPNAYYFTSQSEMLEPEEYTIIGLYRQQYEWGDVYENTYTFTPNTIFVPENAVSAAMSYGTQGVFKTLILKNGCIEAFDAIVLNKEFETMKPNEGEEEMFIYYDQGYSQVMESFYGYQELVKQVLTVGVTVYGVILLLFLLLYPARLGAALRTMASLGTPRRNRLGHVLLSALGILLPGTVLGCALALMLWGPVVSRLLTAGDANFSLSLDLGTLAAVAGVQLMVALLLTLLIALPMTRNSSLMKRK